LLQLSLILILQALFTPAQAAEPESELGFDHFSTGFPLIGRHEFIDCSECHIAGQFKGTPMECGLCHNNIRAPGKHPQHVPSTNFCDDCHTERTWLGARYDHIGIAGSCVTCHNNSIAIGKSASHILTTDICEDCHNTITFDRVARVDHASVIGVCSSCHNGVVATGMHSTHIPLTSTSTTECDECHTTTTWRTRFNHSLTVGNCSNCHNGVFATGPDHDDFTTSDDCLECHETTGWLPADEP
jgi:Cytochrome c7 and related cytochrome c